MTENTWPQKIDQLSFGQYNMHISPRGLHSMLKTHDPNDPAKNVVWTTDPTIELSVLVAKEGPASTPPITIMELWKKILKDHGIKPAIADKIDGKWQALSFNEYHDLIVKFALGLIRLGISERSAVSILGYNCSNWFIDYFGAIFANCIACGHYLTNQADAVAFVIEHSNTELFVAENQEQLDKVLQVWHKLPMLK